jgi:hypothetical protein
VEFFVFKWSKKELVYVLSVILVVYVISAFQLKIGEIKTRDVRRKDDVEQVGRALDAYASDHNGIYPETVWGPKKNNIEDSDGVVYMKSLPKDPSEDRSYIYQLSEDKHKYKIYIALEYLSDPGIRKGLTIECGNKVQCNWYVEN